MVTNDERYAHESQRSTAMGQAAVNKKTRFTTNLGLDLRKKPVKCYIWGTAETWDTSERDQK